VSAANRSNHRRPEQSRVPVPVNRCGSRCSLHPAHPAIAGFVCLLLFAAPLAVRPDDPPSASRFVQLAALLAKAPSPLPEDFARAGLAEMIQAYAEEADLALQDRRARARNPGLPRWSRNVASYALHLRDMAVGLDNGGHASISVGPGGQVLLFLDSGPVVVSGPRISEPGVLEERILRRFCARHPCESLLAMHRPVSAPPKPPSPVRALLPVSVSWVFNARGGPRCRGDGGLELQFRDSRELLRKRRLCTRVVRELNALAAALESRLTDGGVVQWEDLQVASDSVRLNRAGEQLRLDLPTLAAAPEIVSGARDWLAARAGGGDAGWVLNDAGRFLDMAGL
jgi:hypothetical protein